MTDLHRFECEYYFELKDVFLYCTRQLTPKFHMRIIGYYFMCKYIVMSLTCVEHRIDEICLYGQFYFAYKDSTTRELSTESEAREINRQKTEETAVFIAPISHVTMLLRVGKRVETS